MPSRAHPSVWLNIQALLLMVFIMNFLLMVNAEISVMLADFCLPKNSVKSSVHTMCPRCAACLLHPHLFLFPFISNTLSSCQMWWYKCITDVPSVCLGASFVFLISANLLTSFLLNNWKTVDFLFSPSLLGGKTGGLNRGRAACIARQRLCILHSPQSTG